MAPCTCQTMCHCRARATQCPRERGCDGARPSLHPQTTPQVMPGRSGAGTKQAAARTWPRCHRLSAKAAARHGCSHRGSGCEPPPPQQEHPHGDPGTAAAAASAHPHPQQTRGLEQPQPAQPQTGCWGLAPCPQSGHYFGQAAAWGTSAKSGFSSVQLR